MATETLYIRDERGEFIPATGDDLVAAAKHHLSRRVRRGAALTSPRLVRDYLKVRLGARDCEYFCLLLLDTWHRTLDFVELSRNGGVGCYRAVAAHKDAWRRALRAKLCKLATHPHLRRVVATLLQRNWSPQHIAGWLRLNHPRDEAFWVSHETIYRSLYVQVSTGVEL